MNSVSFNRIFDANINRISEGLRVIEEYTRFIANHTKLTETLSGIRKKINLTETLSDQIAHLNARDSQYDVRAGDVPAKRADIQALLKANFKRVEEGLRVLEEYSGNALYTECRYAVYQLEKEIVLAGLKKPIRKGIYLISDSVEVLEQGLKWGVSLIQLRDKAGSKSDVLAKAIRLQKMASETDIPFIVNDYLDIAILVNADGFHSGQDDIGLESIRRLLGPHKLIGRTTHCLEQGLAAEAEGADYVSVGPLWETPSKPNRKGIGFEYLKLAAEKLTIPYVAIGGVNRDTVKEVMTYHPPLVGLIRDYLAVPGILQTYF